MESLLRGNFIDQDQDKQLFYQSKQNDTQTLSESLECNEYVSQGRNSPVFSKGLSQSITPKISNIK